LVFRDLTVVILMGGEGVEVSERQSMPSYVGQVECDPDGALWAVLYRNSRVVNREQVSSVRQGKRRVTDLVLSAADALVERPSRVGPTHLNRMVEPRVPMPRHRRAPVAGIG
jgi:hypothetical protein